MTLQPTIEEFKALQQALQAALSQREKLTSELRFVSTERDLLKQRLDKMLRKLFAAKSEARGTEQKDMFFNEAEALVAAHAVPPHTSQALEHPTAQQPNTHRPASSKLGFEPVKCMGWGTPSAGTPKQLQYATVVKLHQFITK